MIKKYITVLIILAAGFLNAQSIEVYADTDTTEYVVGDYIHYRLELRYTNDIKVELPSVIDSISMLEFINEEPAVVRKNDNETFELREFVFSKYDSAEVSIPGYSVKYYAGNEADANIINVNPVTILVRTIEVDPSGDIQDVKAPIKIELNWLLFSVIALLLIALILAAYILYQRYKNKRQIVVKEKKIIKVPAYRIALEELDELDSKKLWQQGFVKEYHSELTGIIRKYFESRFNFPALELTSAEILANLGISDADEQVKIATNEFLSNADMVKFAKFKPMPSVNEEMMKQAYDIIDKTKQDDEVKVESVEVQSVQ
ncbi:MAG: hypothetical protein JW995_04940 [Melioribacteraceae bacterium]|nr:hypothetical protein [Melioribacteraceae bacterium]